MKSLTMTSGLALLAALGAASALAQTPQRTTATYGSWTVRCEMSDAGSKACEMVQAITVQGQAAPIAQVAIGPREGGDYRLVVQLPIAVWLPADVKLAAGDDAIATAEFKRCFPQFCLAEADMPAATLDGLLSRTGDGAVSFQDAGQRAVSVPLSFDGLADAYTALAADSQAKSQ